MIGHEARDLANEEWYASRDWRLKHNSQTRWRSETRARTARSADAAHRCRVSRIAGIVAGSLVVVAVAVLVGVFLRGPGTAVLPLAQDHQHAGVTAQRQRREQQGQQ